MLIQKNQTFFSHDLPIHFYLFVIFHTCVINHESFNQLVRTLLYSESELVFENMIVGCAILSLHSRYQHMKKWGYYVFGKSQYLVFKIKVVGAAI